MKIYIVRHGQTEWNTIPRWQGNLDIPLNERGIGQARRLADKLSALKISRIYTSPLKRASETAEIIARKNGGDILYRKGLREIHLGRWEGLTTDEINQTDEAAYRKWKENPYEPAAEGIESFSELQKRALFELEAICKEESRDFLAVTHGTWIICLLCGLLGIPLTSRGRIRADNGGCTILERGDSAYTVITLNAPIDAAML